MRHTTSRPRGAAPRRRFGRSAWVRLWSAILLLVIAAPAVFGTLAALVRRLMRAVFRRTVDDLTLENLVKQATYYAIWGTGLLVAVDALGFALKDIISNFVSGILILALRPFQIGDRIVVGETEGGVERIRLRATEIRTYGGRLVLVPNAELFTSRLTNNTASPVRRASVQPYLGQDDVVVQVRFWADSRRSDFVATRSAVRAAVVESLRTAGIPLPDPDVRILVPRDPVAWRAALRPDCGDAARPAHGHVMAGEQERPEC